MDICFPKKTLYNNSFHTFLFEFLRRRSHLYFKYEGESDTCRFGLATTRKGAGLASNGEEGQVYEAFNGEMRRDFVI